MKLTQQEWEAEGRKLFGSDKRKWKFICPNCGHVQSSESIRKAIENGTLDSKRNFLKGDIPPVAYCECTASDCTYVGYGLIPAPITVIINPEEDYDLNKMENCALSFNFYRGEEDESS
jgi:hypothetical protein